MNKKKVFEGGVNMENKEMRQSQAYQLPLTVKGAKITGKLYELPLIARKINVGKSMFGLSKCLHIDEVGVFVYYDTENQLDQDFIRRHLVFREETNCIVEAGTPEEAIKIFFEEWEGAKIGGASEGSKALRINREKLILELPFCELLDKNSMGEFICGEESLENDSGNGIFGMCVMENYDAPDNCPIAEFYGAVFCRTIHDMKDIKEDDRLLIKTFQFEGKEYVLIIKKG